jgi:tRNA threonylcarbamoyladenosine biosynthesis protein TsaE
MPVRPTSPPARPDLISQSERDTRRLGERLGALCQPGDLILLVGTLGAGKTALAQGIGRGLGITATINSPTFTLIKEYSGRLPLYHFDLYRLEDPEAVVALGLDDYLDDDGVCVVEWADRAESLWPPRWLGVRLVATRPRERYIYVEGCGSRAQALRDALLRAVPGSAHQPAHEWKTV